MRHPSEFSRLLDIWLWNSEEQTWVVCEAIGMVGSACTASEQQVKNLKPQYLRQKKELKNEAEKEELES